MRGGPVGMSQSCVSEGVGSVSVGTCGMGI